MATDDPIDELMADVREGLRISDLAHNDFTVKNEDVRQLLAAVERLKAENDAAWDTLADLGDYLTPEQISAELARRGIDVSKAIERVRAALRARKGSEQAERSEA
jgi:uncharacterized protein (UPF0335 family)